MRSAALAVVLLAEVPATATETEPPRPVGRLRAAMVDAAWIGGAAALDLYSTELVLRNGGREANPFMRGGLPARVGAKLVVVGTGVALSDHLRRHGHRNQAKVVRWVFVGAQIGFAAWNLRQPRQRTSP